MRKKQEDTTNRENEKKGSEVDWKGSFGALMFEETGEAIFEERGGIQQNDSSPQRLRVRSYFHSPALMATGNRVGGMSEAIKKTIGTPQRRTRVRCEPSLPERKLLARPRSSTRRGVARTNIKLPTVRQHPKNIPAFYYFEILFVVYSTAAPIKLNRHSASDLVPKGEQCHYQAVDKLLFEVC